MPAGVPIGRVLLLLVIGSLLPVLLIGALLASRVTALQEEELRRALASSAEALSLALDREFAGYLRMLSALAAAETIDRGQIEVFAASARRAARTSSAAFISLFRPDASRVFTVGWPQPQPPPEQLDSVRRAAETFRPATSVLFADPSSAGQYFTVDHPVVRDGRLLYVLSGGFPAEVVSELLVTQALSLGPAGIVDRQGVLVARSVGGPGFVGQRSRLLGNALEGSPMLGAGSGVSREGLQLDFAYHRAEQSGWYAVMTRERRSFQAARDANVQLALALLALGMAAAVGLALVLASRIRRAVRRLAAVAAESAPPPAQPSRIRELAQVEKALQAGLAARRAHEAERASRLAADIRREEAEAANRQKDEFISMLAHELRNPLGAVRNGLFSVLQSARTGSTDSMHAAFAIMQRQLAHLVRLVEDLLDLARMDLGKLQLRKERIDLREALQAAVEASAAGRDAASQALELALPSAPVEVLGDTARLAQVVRNLLDNATKFSPPGTRIALSLEARGGDACIHVRDQGIGIAPELRERIFERYAQGSAATARADGLGIGLALAKILVERHGGSIEASSRGPGLGSTFTVSLPLAGP